jgi:hypothetical protein
MNGTRTRLEAQVNGVPAEEQRWLGAEARAHYLRRSSGPISNPSEFDRQALGLFSSIENCNSDIDEKIAGLHECWQQEGFLARFWDWNKLQTTWQYMASKLIGRDRKMGKTNGMWQLRCNWNRLMLVTNSGKHSGFEMAPGWIGPAPLASREVDAPGVM